VIRHRSNLFTAAGSMALAIGIALHLWTHGNSAHFGSGFLVGMSIALLILGLTSASQPVSGNSWTRKSKQGSRLRGPRISF
jgi:hypothetical protein